MLEALIVAITAAQPLTLEAYASRNEELERMVASQGVEIAALRAKFAEYEAAGRQLQEASASAGPSLSVEAMGKVVVEAGGVINIGAGGTAAAPTSASPLPPPAPPPAPPAGPPPIAPSPPLTFCTSGATSFNLAFITSHSANPTRGVGTDGTQFIVGPNSGPLSNAGFKYNNPSANSYTYKDRLFMMVQGDLWDSEFDGEFWFARARPRKPKSPLF